jgi:pimeloyl-ACP methyl ester carboxylesterase
VKQATEARELLTVAFGGLRLRGTYHYADVSEAAAPRPRIGVLLPNSGVLPRAATGNSAVYWADSFAKCGYPAFRFDLEGLGDSDGHAPARVLDFLARANSGDYAPQISAIAKNIADRFDLSAVVLLAHCGGTVSAIYAAAVSLEIKGLVLLDPYFHLQIFNLERGSAAVQENGLPSNANLPLIACWNQLVARDVPILALTAPSFRAKGAEFDYLGYLQTPLDRERRIIVQSIENTPHSFAEGPGKEGVRKHSEQWLREFFPLTSRQAAKQSLDCHQPAYVSQAVHDRSLR